MNSALPIGGSEVMESPQVGASTSSTDKTNGNWFDVGVTMNFSSVWTGA